MLDFSKALEVTGTTDEATGQSFTINVRKCIHDAI